MKYILMFINDDEYWTGRAAADREKVYAKITGWFEEHGRAGRIVSGEELQPKATATTVRFRGDTALVTDGPFMESKESIGGYAIAEVSDLDAAIAIAKTWPGSGSVEVRPLVDHSQAM